MSVDQLAGVMIVLLSAVSCRNVEDLDTKDETAEETTDSDSAPPFDDVGDSEQNTGDPHPSDADDTDTELLYNTDSEESSPPVCLSDAYEACCKEERSEYCDALERHGEMPCEIYFCCYVYDAAYFNSGICYMVDCTIPSCGDGEINPDDEECDDGNAVSGDGCNAACRTETGFVCSTPGEPCQFLYTCGNNVLDPGEACDDGNLSAGDGCSEECIVEPIYPCYTPDGGVCTQVSMCGDLVLSPPETCDDGNLINGDGCDETCSVEPGYYCPLPGMECVPIETCEQDCPDEALCGDGIIQWGEQCDDGVNDGAYGMCTPECRLGAYCGDGIVQNDISPETGRPYEACDDGVNDGGYEDCAPGCLLGPRCGDGIVQLGYEACDDGEENGLYGKCARDCSAVRRCGDGILQSSDEICDDGNDVNDDFCDNQCRCGTILES